MFSFTKIASFAVLALGILVYAYALPAVEESHLRLRQPRWSFWSDAATLRSRVTKVTSLIQSVTTSLSDLVVQTQAQVLAKLDGSGLLSVGDVAGLVGGLLNIFGVLGPLTTGSGAFGGLGLLTPLLSVVELLVSVVVTLLGTTVSSLLSILLPLILGLVPQLLSLVISFLLGLLGL
ncbi:hypothetical protein HETIRDRAFT_430878 [Heterobasidion irregulare TC 32-1]|uniref:Uncharacterized protein n=1 Tax=Heterobasidion irregulare (strain TC 32-1) TaxID=747525 RepID=W4JPV8_HETIT|nr:uncharacterized protein HETIRDRAFT_430878 [Heterobasidion irregulare TC 32-1]ETW75568.1 hypothetical protein HETIRDRAFT_430878 [Heterobasidion irregulare TC 32-1]